jgi:hypothetical protein
VAADDPATPATRSPRRQYVVIGLAAAITAVMGMGIVGGSVLRSTSIAEASTSAPATVRSGVTPSAAVPAAQPVVSAQTPSAPNDPLLPGFLGSRWFGNPFAADRSNDPVIGVGGWGETDGQNHSIGLAFRAPKSGTLEYSQFLFTDDTTAPGAGYAGGTGGTIVLRLFRADRSGVPVGDPLDSVTWSPKLDAGRVCETPCRYYYNRFPRFDWSARPALTGGERYVVVFTNEDPTPNLNYIRFHGVDFYDEPGGKNGSSYLAGGFSESGWTMVYRPGNGPWLPGRVWPRNTASGYDPVLTGGFRFTDGTSFGQAGWNVGVDHGRFHGPDGKLGSGCDQGGAPTDFRCDVTADASRTQVFVAPSTFPIDQFRIGLAPYQSGNIRLSLRKAANPEPVATCSFPITGLDQSSSHPLYPYVRSRQFECDIRAANIEAGQSYEFTVSSENGAQASVLALGDTTTWPYDPTPPLQGLEGAGAVGHMINPSRPDSAAWDMQYGIRIAVPGQVPDTVAGPALATPSTPKSSAKKSSAKKSSTAKQSKRTTATPKSKRSATQRSTTKPATKTATATATASSPPATTGAVAGSAATPSPPCATFVTNSITKGAVIDAPLEVAWKSPGSFANDGDSCSNGSRWMSPRAPSSPVAMTIRLAKPTPLQSVSVLWDGESVAVDHVVTVGATCTSEQLPVEQVTNWIPARTDPAALSADPPLRWVVRRTYSITQQDPVGCVTVISKKLHPLAVAAQYGFSIQEVLLEPR